MSAQDNSKICNNQNISKLTPSQMISVPLKAGTLLDVKIDPLLRYFINEVKSCKRNTGIIHEKYSLQPKLLTFNENISGDIVVSIFIKSNDIGYTKYCIENQGGTITTISGNIIVAELPVLEIEQLAENSEVIYIEGSHYSKAKLNESHVEIGADKVHNGTGLPQSYKGEGVVVGVVDSGIDWEHGDFDNSSGASRILYLWDMSGSGNPPSGYSYGTEYTKTQIDAGQCSEVDGDDGHGHGTHVSATAAGLDNSLSGYTGIAPASDIVFVKGFRNGPGFGNTDVVDGCSYIFSKAQSFGKPSVINLSLGGHFGAHDGTSLYEQALSNLTGPGKIIVAAAGNEGNNQIHVGYTTGGQNETEARQTLWVIPQGAPSSLVDFWYTPGNISVGIAAYDASFNIVGYTNGVPAGQKIEDIPFTISGGQTLAHVTIDATSVNDPNNGNNRVILMIDSKNGQYNLNAVYWTLFTFGSGTFDAWMVQDGYFTPDDIPANLIYPGDNNKSIGMPGTAQKVICVGSYVTKNQWIDIDGSTQTQPGNPTIGNISSFSSLGPTHDNRMKPDLSAPGEVIVAALSGDLTIGPDHTPRANILQGGKHQKMQGTSMASPHVTGTVALMLQKNHNLDYNQVFSTLTASSRKDNFTGSSANNTYGYGKLNAYQAVLSTPGGGPQPTNIIVENFDAGSFPPSGWTTQVMNANNTWSQGNPANNNFNQIDPSNQFSAICPWVAENQDEWLSTSSFAIGSGTASLEFYAGYSTDWLSAATLKLHISTNGGTTWTNLWQAENDGQSWIWRQKTIDLSSYANNQNLRIAWQYVGNDGDLVGLDGVHLVALITDVDDNDKTIPANFELSQNYPNPFNPGTVIKYQLAEACNVTLRIYDILGREVAVLVDEEKPAGVYRAELSANSNGVDLSSGVYFYELAAGNFRQTKKMILLR